jgi:hypothetical protein
MWILYLLVVTTLCTTGLIWVVLIGYRDIQRALRTGRILGRGNVEHDRRTSPIAFWVTFLTAIIFFLCLGIFLIGIFVLYLLFSTGILP